MSWQNIEGHDEVVRSFQQALERGRLAHAYLLVGPPGVGKRLFARALAQTLLCEGRAANQFQPCGQCAACAQVRADSHPDLIQVGRGSDEHELPIDTIRQVIHDLGFKPARGRYKITIVDDADDMNQASANCFLKCLEEPPPRSLLILVGTSVDVHLATVRSRCQLIRFGPLPESVVARVLLETGIVEHPAEADRLAAMSGGSLEWARGLADPRLWNFREDLARALARGRVDTMRLAESANEIVESASKETAAKRARAKLLLAIAGDLLDCCLRLSVGAGPRRCEPSLHESLGQISRRRDPETIADMIEQCFEANYHLDRMGSIPLVIDAWTDRMAQAVGS